MHMVHGSGGFERELRRAQLTQQAEVRCHESIKLLKEMKQRRERRVYAERWCATERLESGRGADASVKTDKSLDPAITHGGE